jgi:hypothetical protein
MDEACAPDRRTQGQACVQELCRLLEEQITCVRGGDLSCLERLTERTDALVARIAPAGGPEPCGARAGWERMQKLYAELRLALMAQREETRTALRAVRRGGRMVRTYGNHISPA